MHCYLPIEILKGEITPVIKDVKGNKNDINNYRPVMVSSSILKIIEKHILNIISKKLKINPRQFGFVKQMSTTDATFLLKETVNNYIYK